MSTKHLILPVVALAMLASRADAGFWTFSGPIDGSQEVPPTGSSVVGSVSGDYNDVTNVLNILAFADGFTTAVLDSHIHGPAAPGSNAGVLIPLGAGGGFGYDYYKSLQFTLTPLQEGYFLGGLTYINVHTSLHPGGEIRGQLNPVPEPGTMVALGLGAAALLARRRRKAA